MVASVRQNHIYIFILLSFTDWLEARPIATKAIATRFGRGKLERNLVIKSHVVFFSFAPNNTGTGYD